jgi:hypothetical protein
MEVMRRSVHEGQVKKMGGKDNWLERGETDLREIRVEKGRRPERGKTERKGKEEVAREGEGGRKH